MAVGHDRGVERVHRVRTCRLTAIASRWAFSIERAEEIDRHWARRSAENPGFFNGTIYVLEQFTVEEDGLAGRLMPVDFKSFLFWKEQGYPDRTVRDCFGSALVRSAEGYVLLGRQRKGNINAGLAYLPGGFIDPRDVADDGTIDVCASIMRELAEETGLKTTDLAREPGFLLTFAGPMLSIAVELRSSLSADMLKLGVREHIASDREGELEDVVLVRGPRDLGGLSMPLYAGVLLGRLFGGAGAV